jgi:CHAT domain-containing protein
LPVFVAEEAEVCAALGSLYEADALYQRATSLVEGLLVNAPSSRVKSSMIGAMSEIYLGHFRLVWNQLHNGAEAFRIIESARGRALLDSMRYANQTGASTGSAPIEREISQLQGVLLHTKLSATQTQRVLIQLDDAYDRLVPIEYAKSRAEMTMLRRQPTSVTELRKRLQPGECLVEYVVDTKASYAIVVTSSGLTIHSLPGRAQLTQSVKTFVGDAKSKKDVSVSGQALYKTLIAPLAMQPRNSLVIVPDGLLNLVPFAALITNDAQYFGTSLTVSSSPSATIYVSLKAARNRTTASRPFLGVAYSPIAGTPDHGIGVPIQTASISRSLEDLRGKSPAPLEFARQEVMEAANSISPKSVTLVGGDATESALKAQPLSDFKIIHLAAHGIGDDTEPDRSGLVLFPGNEDEDGLWQSREIRRARLNADVVVLSACETGTGRLQGEEGVMNLGRSFLTAGARSVVASLWSVEDSSTATLMGFFYEHLASGMTVGESLRRAQVDYRKEFKGKAQPYYWAGFEVIGDGSRRINLETHKSNLQASK